MHYNAATRVSVHPELFDNCNSILIGLPWSTITPLQRVQNAAARLLMGLPPRDYVRPELQETHWLPVSSHITFQVALLMFLVHMNQCLAYIIESVTSVSCCPPQRRLRCSAGTNCIVRQGQGRFGKRTILVAGAPGTCIRSATSKNCLTWFQDLLF